MPCGPEQKWERAREGVGSVKIREREPEQSGNQQNDKLVRCSEMVQITGTDNRNSRNRTEDAQIDP